MRLPPGCGGEFSQRRPGLPLEQRRDRCTFAVRPSGTLSGLARRGGMLDYARRILSAASRLLGPRRLWEVIPRFHADGGQAGRRDHQRQGSAVLVTPPFLVGTRRGFFGDQPPLQQRIQGSCDPAAFGLQVGHRQHAVIRPLCRLAQDHKLGVGQLRCGGHGRSPRLRRPDAGACTTTSPEWIRAKPRRRLAPAPTACMLVWGMKSSHV